MTNEEIQKLKDAGIDDATIQGIIAEDAAKQGSNVQAGAPATPVAPEGLPEIDVTQKSDTLKNAQAAGVPTTNEGSLMADAAALGAAAAPYAGPAALGGLGIYGAAKVGGWGSNLLSAAQQASEAYKTGVTQNAATQQFRALERMARIPGPEGELAKQRLQELMRAQSGIQQGGQQAGKQAFQQMGQQLTRGPVSGPVNPGTVPTAGPAQAQPSMMQRGMDMASKIRQTAANRIIGLGAVPGAVAAGGAAATGLAGGQMAAMTPEQRKAYYDNMMLGAMGGDAALGAAIMNRGQ